MRKTKIVCTIGPASEKVDTLCQLILQGMNVARLNFSHGDHFEHQERIINIREAIRITGRQIAIMLDTQGPEIRTGILKEGKIILEPGSKVFLTTEEILGDQKRIHINYPNLTKDVHQKDTILIDDGLIALEVLEIAEHDVLCLVLNGGELNNRKGVNIPGVNVSLPAVTEKDISDIKFGVEQGVDFIAASFIRTANDALEIRRILESLNADLNIIAKIENAQGVQNADEIIKVTNGIMVARGDLGVEIPAEDVPLVQKSLIEKCNCAGKPVIIATQMLDSMIRNPRPTRAEASDVANAILDGTDAIMLSGETAAGKYPIEAVRTMDLIARKAETAIKYDKILRSRKFIRTTTPDAISHATCAIAEDLEADAIITATESGSTSRMVAKHRPRPKIIAVTPSRVVQRRLLLVWGVEPLYAPGVEGTDAMVEQAIDVSLATNLIKNGDLVVITTGVPVGIPGTTNLLKVETVGQYLAKGMGLGQDCVTGVVRLVNDGPEAVREIKPGEILVAAFTDADFVPAMQTASVIITERAGLTSHAAIVGLNLGVPVVVGVKNATNILQTGMLVSVDVNRGLIYRGKANI